MLNISLLIGHTVHILETVDSTNNYIAKHDDAHNLSDGTVIMSNFQTAGKGRYNRDWQSNKGENLTFSFLIKPRNLKADKYYAISKWVSIAICMWMKNLNLNARIKLPNDIYVSDKKICGILIENKWQSDLIKRAIVGIGINLNQMEFSDDFRAKATSAFLETQQKADAVDALNELNSFLSYYLNTFISNPEKIESTFDHFLIKRYRIQSDQEDLGEGRIIKVENDGSLHFELKNGNKLNAKMNDLKLRLLPPPAY